MGPVAGGGDRASRPRPARRRGWSRGRWADGERGREHRTGQSGRLHHHAAWTRRCSAAADQGFSSARVVDLDRDRPLHQVAARRCPHLAATPSEGPVPDTQCAEAHDPPATEHARCGCPVGCADRVERVEGSAGARPCSGPASAPMGGAHRIGHVGAGRGAATTPSGERGVEAVVDHQDDVSRPPARARGVTPHTLRLVEVQRRVSKRRVGLDRL